MLPWHRLLIAFAAGTSLLAAAPAFALAVKMENVLVTQYIVDSPADDLPAPPKLAAPSAAPHRSRPPMVTMTWGSRMPALKKPAAPAANLESLKSK